MDEGIIRKIKHLLNLKSSPNEHESALAAMRVQELLSQYNLSLSEVEANTSGQKKADVPGGKRGKSFHQGSALYHYQRDLMAALCANNFVYHEIRSAFKKDPKGKKLRWLYDSPKNITTENRGDTGRMADTHVLIGREENVAGVGVMYDYLTEAMDRLLPWQGMEKRGKDALLWLAGCTERLIERLNERRYEMERQSREAEKNRPQGQEAGLVLSSVYASESDYNEDIRWGLELGTTARQRREREARYAADRAKEKELIDGGCPVEDAYYIARGLNPPEKVPEIVKEESEAERIKREKKEERDNARWDNARWKERQKENQKRSSPAFRHGVASGDDIGLDSQVKSGERRKIG